MGDLQNWGRVYAACSGLLSMVTFCLWQLHGLTLSSFKLLVPMLERRRKIFALGYTKIVVLGYSKILRFQMRDAHRFLDVDFVRTMVIRVSGKFSPSIFSLLSPKTIPTDLVEDPTIAIQSLAMPLSLYITISCKGPSQSGMLSVMAELRAFTEHGQKFAA